MENGWISKEDSEWINGDSRRFLERALLRAETWEEGLRYAKELRALQHPTLSAIASREEKVGVIELRWTTPSDGVASNELSVAKPNEVALNEVKASVTNEVSVAGGE